MAQTAKTPRKRTSSANGSSRGSSSSTKSASAKRSSSSRASTNGSSARKPAATRKKSSTSTRSTRTRSKSRSSAQSKNGSGSFGETAVEKTKHAAQAVAGAASKAKTPLIAGGTALVGAAAGAVVKDRLGTKRSKNPLTKLRGVSLPRPSAKLSLPDLDLDKVKSTADRVSAYAQQASDTASAVQKARKKNKV